MKIEFHGAAQTVTGSKHLIKLKSGKSILLDCGLFQGGGIEAHDLNQKWGFEPREISYMILSHAHIDHSGLIPKLVKDGYRGPIYCTPATKDLAEVLLYDSAFIQENDIRQVNKHRARLHKPPVKPLYEERDVKVALGHFETVSYNEVFSINNEINFHFTDAGHIVGSAAVHIDIIENKEKTKITFTGDIGRYKTPILKSPETFRQADILITESTYGNKLHDDRSISANLLLSIIKETCLEKKGKLIIPAFSVGRTQEILFALNQLDLLGQLPNVPYYLDSPLSTEATTILKQHKECFNKNILKIMESDKDPFGFENLSYVIDRESSQSLNKRNDAMVIISASGMAEAGRVKHHIAHAIENPNNTICMVGYCEPYSLGGKLSRGDKEVKIFGIPHKVIADVKVLHSFSAHGDYDDICQFFSCQNIAAIKHLFVVHGEYDVQKEFKKRMLKKGFNLVDIPALHQSFNL
jgi:metallo-beta-lactamase family protein